MMIYSCFSACVSRFLASVGSCLGCCTKSLSFIAADDASRLRIQDDFWSTSTYDLDNSVLQSQRSFSSIAIPNLTEIQSTGANNHSEFVNHGLLLWTQSSGQWRGIEKSGSRGKVIKHVLSWNTSYDNLLSTSKRFPQPVPLSEMVDFLVDTWDQEGLYD